MKRSDFLKKLGIGIGVAVVAPKALVGIPAKEKTVDDIIKSTQNGLTPNDFKDSGWINKSDWDAEVGRMQKYYVGCDLIDENPECVKIFKSITVYGDGYDDEYLYCL